MNKFLPISKKDMDERGISQLDFVYITGDAYVDHPSFGTAIISRVLENEGFSIGIIAQPNFHDLNSYTILGEPKLGFLVSAGNIDSMVAHYSVAKKRREKDEYSKEGKMGYRPDRAVTVYSNALKRLYPEKPVIIGGLEASLRRFAHYDYWDDKVFPSILVDSKADLLIYGMGEHQIVEVARQLKEGVKVDAITDVRGTCYLTEPKNTPFKSAECASFEQVSASKELYAKATKIQYENQDELYGKTVIQRHGNKMLVQNPPTKMLTTAEFDAVYELPYAGTYHPIYEKTGGISAIREVEFSIIHNRGCFGACNFCSIALHQGRKIAVRSEKSILNEAKKLSENPNFKGYIHDVGGPTANFRHLSCKKQEEFGLCKNKKCLAPYPCKNLEVSHKEYLELLRKISKIEKVKKVFIRSGIRFDYLLEDKDDDFFFELVKNHVSGQLKVAPEHCSAVVLDKMGKPYIDAYKKFQDKFYSITKKVGKEQYLVPYLMSSHPGSTLKEAVELALFLKSLKIRPEQVQDFYPTPGTISTCMYYTGLDPYTMEKVYVAKTPKEKSQQRALLQYYKPQNQQIIIDILTQIKRSDLIGNGKNFLVSPTNNYLKIKNQANSQPKTSKYTERNGRKYGKYKT